MFKVTENIVLLDYYLALSGLVVSVEVVVYVGTYQSVLVVILVLEHEALTVLEVFQTVEGDQNDPVFMGFG